MNVSSKQLAVRYVRLLARAFVEKHHFPGRKVRDKVVAVIRQTEDERLLRFSIVGFAQNETRKNVAG